ncbi:MAG: calcineurin [Kofleriaceae bacterium]|nr:calcineurin [Kofleriaceae bacterium]
MPRKRRRWSALTPVLMVAAIGCDRGHRDAPAPVKAPVPAAPSAGPAKTGCTLAPIPTKVPLSPKRIVAIGDLHGDLAATRATLKVAGAIDDADKWIGGTLVVVQTGDILDRGDDESKILDLFDRLATEASAAGGAVVRTLGNHEFMNAARDFRYVTPGGMHDFGGERTKALDPGGAWAKRLATHNVVAIVGDSVFSHAGVIGDWVTHVDEANLAARCWLDGQAGGPDAPSPVLTSDDSPVWTRTYGLPDAVDCAALADTLQKLGAARMVVGHTPQQTGITSACDGKLWRIDVGLSKHYGGPIQVLEISGSDAKVLTGTR